VTEDLLIFGEHGNLVGVFAQPARQGRTAVILLNAGLIPRVGPGRLHVRLARELAAKGIGCLRFDFSGVGDSPARPDDLPIFEQASREPSEAVDALKAVGHSDFVLVGICSGAVAALMSAARDSRVSAVIAINPPSLDADPNAETRTWWNRYLKRSLFSPRAWCNLVTGRVDYQRLFQIVFRRVAGQKNAANSATPSPDVKAYLSILNERKCRVMFLLSGEDVSVDHVGAMLGQDLRRNSRHPSVDVFILSGADHLFMRECDKVAMIETILSFVARQERHLTPNATPALQ
jgi:pimeloyl-ACP methyl ester carboxylesterase